MPCNDGIQRKDEKDVASGYAAVTADGAVARTVASQLISTSTHYTVVPATDRGALILVDASGGNRIVILPPASGAGETFIVGVKKVDSSGNTVTVDGDATETIDGSATRVLSSQHEVEWYVCDGSNWRAFVRAGGVTDHGALSGLSDDDHPQYVLEAAATLTGSLALTGDLSPAQITADADNYSVANIADNAVLRLSTDASRTLTGLAGGTDGKVLLVLNVGSNDLVLSSEDAASTAANRFAFDADLTLTGGTGVLLWYDATSSRWRKGSPPAGSGSISTDTGWTALADGSGHGDLKGGVDINTMTLLQTKRLVRTLLNVLMAGKFPAA